MATRRRDEKTRPDPGQPGFPIVGIGASAGGIAALKAFFEAMPQKPGMAFVVILHLTPDKPSHLATIIGRSSPIPVVEITGDIKVEKNNVYVIAPDQELVLEDDMLRVRPSGDRPHHPVDTLLKSLAEEKRERAAAVILSGSGTNGAAGVFRIKQEDGVVFVQQPETAEYDGMPRAAIGTGVVDRILPPAAMAAELIEYVRYLDANEALPPAEAKQAPIITLLRARAGYDFRPYKANTLLRRIQRRMGLRRLDTIAAYVEMLHDEPAEVEALTRDLLINVTGFFRDEAAWQALAEKVIKPLVTERDADQPIRAWSPGCSTGEEAYSLAMLLMEAVEAAGKPLEIKVFATDPAPHVLARARAGSFPASVAEVLPPERLRHFFDRDGDTFVAKKKLRDVIVFAPQNVLSDPPFSNLDIVCCRNLLIYLQPEAQRRILSLLHFSLRRSGYLFLGPSESVADHGSLFESVVKKWRIYRRTGGCRPAVMDFSRSGTPSHDRAPLPTPMPQRGPSEAERTREALLEDFAPPSVLIDRNFTILYFHGSADIFLSHPKGEPTYGLLRLAQPRFVPSLRSLVQQVLEDKRPARIAVRTNGDADAPTVEIVARPLGVGGDDPSFILVSFLGSSMSRAAPGAWGEGDSDQALRAAREELRYTIAELERSNEDLRASNEEVSSINEEFQAANEELETSKEELQSLNEELITVNVQLQEKVEELEALTNDLNNTLNSSAVVTLFLDSQSRIRWFTPATRDLFSLTASDIGRSVTDFARHFMDPAFMEDIERVLRDLQPREAEVLSAASRWFLRRTLPYRTEDDRISGVVVTFVEITARKQAEEGLRVSEQRFRALVEASAQMVWNTNAEGIVVEDSPSWRAFTGQTREEWIGHTWAEAVHPEDRARAQEAWRDAVAEESPLEGKFRLWRANTRTWRHMMVRAVPRLDPLGHVQEWVGMTIDVTDEHEAGHHQQMLLDELQHRMKNLFANIVALLRLSSHSATDIKGLVGGFTGRLAALERTQNLLGVHNAKEVDVRELVATELLAHGASPGERIRLAEVSCSVPQKVAQVLGMVVHELATNSRKYGALRHEGATLAVAWTLVRNGIPRLVFSWRESGVPMPESLPKAGFGSRLIEEAAPYMLHGKSKLTFEADGVRCELDVPLVPR